MPLSILSVASEMAPLVKTGGLADVVGALPVALARQDVIIQTLLPGYPAVLAALRDARAVHEDPALFGGPARLLRGPGLFVLDAPHLYDRPGALYDGPSGPWPDNPARFAALARVAAQMGQGLLPDARFDVVHAHDWQAGLLPAYLHYDGLPHAASVITIHNLAFQGGAPAGWLPALGLPPEAWTMHGVESYGEIGFLKAGLLFADQITTVSPSYATEICTAEGGMGLDGLLRARQSVLSGVLNGLDTEIWNPARDPHLPAPYDAATLMRRAINKAALQARLGLEADPGAPLCAVISRLSGQKGLDFLLGLLPDLIGWGGQLAVLGTGDPGLESAFRQQAARFPGRIGLFLGFDDSLAHLFQGAADLFLMPSRFEPCGLTQLAALRYGALPVVMCVGGLADTIIDANEAALTQGVATGFQCGAPSLEALRAGLRRAFALWRDQPIAWRQMQENAMRCDVGWDQPAARYAAIYRAAVGRG